MSVCAFAFLKVWGFKGNPQGKRAIWGAGLPYFHTARLGVTGPKEGLREVQLGKGCATPSSQLRIPSFLGMGADCATAALWQAWSDALDVSRADVLTGATILQGQVLRERESDE